MYIIYIYVNAKTNKTITNKINIILFVILLITVVTTIYYMYNNHTYYSLNI